MSKHDPVSINALVNKVSAETHEKILSQLKDFEDSQRFLVYSRIVLRLFQAHFGYVMRLAEEKVDQPIKPEKSNKMAVCAECKTESSKFEHSPISKWFCSKKCAENFRE